MPRPLRPFLWLLLLVAPIVHAQKIDRRALVRRHRVVLTRIDTLGALTVGNGGFAFTVDATGLQSFPDAHAHGIPLGTQSDWGWHRFPNPAGYKPAESHRSLVVAGRRGAYAVQPKEPGRAQAAANYFRENPHRLQLGNVGLDIIRRDGTPATPADLTQIHQELDPWTGLITSRFAIEDQPVSLTTAADPQHDRIAVRIESPLLATHQLRLRFRFPYPTNTFTDAGTNHAHPDRHTTTYTPLPGQRGLFSRQLDQDRYTVTAQWQQPAAMQAGAPHTYQLIPQGGTTFEATVTFSPTKATQPAPRVATVLSRSAAGWRAFWLSGGAVELAGSTDPRAAELERRIVLSQYLTRVQCAGTQPPQETGLTYNSWYGRPHMEMYWWHSAHIALWGRPELLRRSLGWYARAFDPARALARRQGFAGVRWQKMTDPAGGEGPSSVGSFLIWQQPHPIYLANLLYRQQPSRAVLDRYKSLVFATADFMASFARYDSIAQRYVLGYGLIPAQECFDPATTLNPPFELAYWHWGLQTAQQWRRRLGLPLNPRWQAVIDRLPPLAQRNGVYQAAESVHDSYSPASRYTIDHPAVLGALGMLPDSRLVDTTIMRRTLAVVDTAWQWSHTWGWDFPMVAMTATRLHQPEQAIDALFRAVTTNTYLVNGHNYQDKRLTLYLPGNGGLLAAVALMCAGFDGNHTPNPGFPANGQWQVRWEGLRPMP